jgi:predicted ATPase/transcriptional regulator with XRE-family HTH domain
MIVIDHYRFWILCRFFFRPAGRKKNLQKKESIIMTGGAPPFAALLRGFRDRAELTQEALAARAGISPDAVGLLERGDRRRPHTDTVARLAAALELSAAERVQFEMAARRPAALRLQTPQPQLPTTFTPFVGRTDAIDRIAELFRQPTVRLITLTGPGGVGKTRLALAAAERLSPMFADRVVFVSLAAVTDPALVNTTIARALGLRDRGDRPALDQLHDALRSRQTLLILDNLEQVVEAAPDLATLLAGVPGLRLLATSRAVLRIAAEQVFSVPPLELPIAQTGALTAAEIEAAPAVQLFIDRARAAVLNLALTAADLTAVAAICERLDGLPLAIELAAARCRVLPPRALLARLQTSPFETLGASGRRDLPARQQTLRAILDWSFDLLAEREQALLTGLGVFASSFTLAFACDVLGAEYATLDTLATLIDHSLVQRIESAEGEPRFAMLEVVRAYALDRLAAAGRADAVCEQHALAFLALAEEAELGLRGPEQGAWLARLDVEQTNLSAALTWTLGGSLRAPASHAGTSPARPISSPAAPIGARLAAALVPFWWRRGYAGEGQRWVTLALAAIANVDVKIRSRLLAQAGRLAWLRGEYAVAVAHSEKALRCCRESGDIGSAAFVLTTLGMVAWHQGQSAAAEQYLTESLSLAETANSDWQQAATCLVLALVAYNRGDHARREALLQRSLNLARTCGDRAGMAETLLWWANIAVEQGELDRAEPGYQEALAHYRELNDRGGVARILHKLADLAHDRGDLIGARELFDECLATLRAIGDRVGIGDALIGLGDVMFKQGDVDGAAACYDQAFALIQARGGQVEQAWTLRGRARVACARGDYLGGQALFAESLRLAQAQANPWGIAVCLEGLGGAIAALGRPVLAAELFGAADGVRAASQLRMITGALPDIDQDRAAVGAALGEVAFAAALARGAARPIEEVISAALAQSLALPAT